MLAADYAEVVALWRASEGIGLTESDSEPGVAAYLARNPDMSAVACDASERIVGAVLCGHDGRRGYLHHLAVTRGLRRSGIGAALVAHCFARLGEAGIPKCNIFLFPDNAVGEAFWLRQGWYRPDWFVMQKPVANDE